LADLRQPLVYVDPIHRRILTTSRPAPYNQTG
jgi:hypothetical protein